MTGTLKKTNTALSREKAAECADKTAESAEKTAEYAEQIVQSAERFSGTVWNAGVYARLSVDSNDCKNESIDTQIEIAKEFISQADDIELAGCYTDLGKTGTNFNREGFERMMEDVRRKKINCVVVKDFSRFGRDYIETGNYIERIFPFMNVRFIAVTDGYDSEHVTGEDARLSMNLKNIVNELYAKDIAQRVKTAKRLKQEMGSYTGGVPPYGYRVQKDGRRNVLFPDTDTKDIVVRIFERYAEGSTYKEIARELYEKKIQRPSVYRATGQVYCTEDRTLQQWPYDTIKWILSNPVYAGTLFQARTCGKLYPHKRHEVDETRDITVVEHAHEPVVSQELFYKVSQRFEKQAKYANSLGFSKKIPQSEDMFQDMVYCSKCGRRLIRNSAIKTLSSGDKVRSYYYSCPNKRKIDASACKSQGISEKDLAAAVQAVLQKEFARSEMLPDDCRKEIAFETEKKKTLLRKQKERYKKEQEELILEGSRLYLKYHEGELSREVFLDGKKKADEKLAELKKLEDEIERQIQQADAGTEQLSQFIQKMLPEEQTAAEIPQTASVRQNLLSGADAKLDRELVKCLVKRIYAGCENKLEMILNYTSGCSLGNI